MYTPIYKTWIPIIWDIKIFISGGWILLEGKLSEPSRRIYNFIRYYIS